MSDYEEIGARSLPEYYHRHWLHSLQSLRYNWPLLRPHSCPLLHYPLRPRHLIKADLKVHPDQEDLHNFILDLRRFDSLGRQTPPLHNYHFLHRHLVSPTQKDYSLELSLKFRIEEMD